MSKAPHGGLFSTGQSLPSTSVQRANGGLLPINFGAKPPSPAKLKPKGAPGNPFAPGAVANPLFPQPVAANPLFQQPAAGQGVNMFAAGGGAAAAPVMQIPTMPLQAVFQAAPVQTRHQKADVAKESFKSGASTIVSSFVTQIFPHACGNLSQSGPQLLQHLNTFIQQHFQGVSSRFVGA
jgi:hypothetical protein